MAEQEATIGEAFTITVDQDERAELTPTQTLVGIAVSLGEASRAILEWAQTPKQLVDELKGLRAEPEGYGLHPFGDALDDIAQAVTSLHFLCAGGPEGLASDHPTEDFAEAAARWLRGEG
jgi:hypothetical protein